MRLQRPEAKNNFSKGALYGIEKTRKIGGPGAIRTRGLCLRRAVSCPEMAENRLSPIDIHIGNTSKVHLRHLKALS